MSRIIIKTGSGLSPAPDVTDALLTSEQVQLERGKAELWSSFDMISHRIREPLNLLHSNGEILEAHVTSKGEGFRGKVVGVSISGTDTNHIVDYKVEVVA